MIFFWLNFFLFSPSPGRSNNYWFFFRIKQKLYRKHVLYNKFVSSFFFEIAEWLLKSFFSGWNNIIRYLLIDSGIHTIWFLFHLAAIIATLSIQKWKLCVFVCVCVNALLHSWTHAVCVRVFWIQNSSYLNH